MKQVLAAVGGNVANMLSNTRGGYGYAIIDVNGSVDADKIALVDGVIRVRAL